MSTYYVRIWLGNRTVEEVKFCCWTVVIRKIERVNFSANIPLFYPYLILHYPIVELGVDLEWNDEVSLKAHVELQ